MSITISDCLQLPSLKNATVIAGKAGLGNIVSSISVLEFIDESLLTSKDTFFSIISYLPSNKRNIKNLMRIISDRLKCSMLLSDSSLTNIHLTSGPCPTM